MHIGLSTYSLLPEIKKNNMTVLDLLDWIAAQGGEHAEIVPFGFELRNKETGEVNKQLIKDIVQRAKSAGIFLSNYSILADLCCENREDFEKEVKRLMAEVEIAAALGVPTMRHDISAFRREAGQNTIIHFEELLPQMVEGIEHIADHAKKYGITTLIENHGFFVNGSDRVIRLLSQIDRDNYGLLLDTGNVYCVDENPATAVKKLVSYTKKVHLKDFYHRTKDPGDTTQFSCSGSWFRTVHGDYLRGAILAQGDLDIYTILSELKKSGYDGDITIEFEGMEDCVYASKVSMDNARRIWDEV